MTDIRHPSVRAGRLDVAAMARGRASEPNLELLANLTGVRAGDRTWSRLRVHALGTSDEFLARLVLEAEAGSPALGRTRWSR